MLHLIDIEVDALILLLQRETVAIEFPYHNVYELFKGHHFTA